MAALRGGGIGSWVKSLTADADCDVSAELFIVGTKSDLPECPETVKEVEAAIDAFVAKGPSASAKLNFAQWRHAVVSARDEPEAAANVLYAAAAVVLAKAQQAQNEGGNTSTKQPARGSCCLVA